ncbi:MAG: CoA ester lyase [Hyphomonadaceae bacterium]|nr:CoA ester lyase [Hyphomonadaceae bacterium]
MKTFRSLLFVPGSRPERFDKALTSGADAVCIDLEDAVPPPDKENARGHVLDYLKERNENICAIGVRINGLDTLDGFRDVLGLADSNIRPDFIMVPKSESSAPLWNLERLLDLRPSQGKRVPIWAVVETVAGMANVSDLAGTCGGRGGILFGGADYSANIGTDMSWEALFYARAQLANQSKMMNGGLLDVPFLDTKDDVGLRTECHRVKAIGFLGKACIHPNQVAIVNEVFSPSAEEIAWAQRVRAANATSQGNALLLDGKLIDAPVYLRAERILEQAGIKG